MLAPNVMLAHQSLEGATLHSRIDSSIRNVPAVPMQVREYLSIHPPTYEIALALLERKMQLR